MPSEECEHLSLVGYLRCGIPSPVRGPLVAPKCVRRQLPSAHSAANQLESTCASFPHLKMMTNSSVVALSGFRIDKVDQEEFAAKLAMAEQRKQAVPPPSALAVGIRPSGEEVALQPRLVGAVRRLAGARRTKHW